jgi:hypothetical protein
MHANPYRLEYQIGGLTCESRLSVFSARRQVIQRQLGSMLIGFILFV